MRAALCSALVLLLGCGDDGADPDPGSCASHSDCEAREICVDGRCAPDPAAGMDAGSRDGGGERRDSGTRDGGERSDAGAPGDGAPGDASCGSTALPIDVRPPNVVVVLDRSCSMRRLADMSGAFGTGPEDPRTRWNIAREAVRALLVRYPSQIRWGLLAYPDPREGCGLEPELEVRPASMTGGDVEGALLSDEVQPFFLCDMGDVQPHQTPTGAALDALLAAPELSAVDRDSFAILLTDGGAGCGSSADSLAAQGAALAAAGIRTAVVGFAGTTGADVVAQLDALALAAGLPRPGGPPHHWFADDAAMLATIFDTIIGETISCTFGLDGTPEEGAELFVSLNDERLPMDAADGYTYDPVANTVTLHGAACARLRSGMVTRISVVFGCPPTSCVPMDEVCNGLDDDCDDVVDESCLM